MNRYLFLSFRFHSHYAQARKQLSFLQDDGYPFDEDEVNTQALAFYSLPIPAGETQDHAQAETQTPASLEASLEAFMSNLSLANSS